MGSARQFVLGYYGLLQPGLSLIGRLFRGTAVYPISAQNSLAAISPGGNPPGVNDLHFDMEAADQEVIAGVFQVLKDRAVILPHKYRVRRVVMNAQLNTHPMTFADLIQSYPGAGSI